MSAPKKILMTGGGAPGAAGIIRLIRAAGNYHITAADVRADVVGRCLADDFVQLPPAADPGFADQLYEQCRQRQIDFVLPLVTRELGPLERSRTLFEREGITLLLISGVLDTANNKGKLYRFFSGEAFIPSFYICRTVNELSSAVQQLGYPGRAVCFKPCVANGSRGFRILDERKDRFTAFFSEKPDQTYTTLDEVRAIFGHHELPELLVTPFFEGVEYSVDAVAIEGRMVVALPRRRLKMTAGISVEGIFEQVEPLISYTRQIVERFQLHGNIGLQFRADGQGKFFLLEINPRVQGGLVTALGAGVNPVGMLLQYHTEGRVDFDPAQVKWGTKFIRYWTEVWYE